MLSLQCPETRLLTQYRSVPQLCRLWSVLYYGGTVVTDVKAASSLQAQQRCLGPSLLFIDTEMPYKQRKVLEATATDKSQSSLVLLQRSC